MMMRDTQTPNIQQQASGSGSNPRPPVYQARELTSPRHHGAPRERGTLSCQRVLRLVSEASGSSPRKLRGSSFNDFHGSPSARAPISAGRMTTMDTVYTLASEGSRSKLNTLVGLSDEEIVKVWDGVSTFIERHMAQHKGVHIPELGTFTFALHRLPMSGGRSVAVRRPVLRVSEKLIQTHGLTHSKPHVSGEIPVVQLNWTALALESGVSRAQAEGAVHCLLRTLERALAGGRSVELGLGAVGLLSVRDSHVKMRFHRRFVLLATAAAPDGGACEDALRAMIDRPGTADSVLPEGPLHRPGTSNTLCLPRMAAPVLEARSELPPIAEAGVIGDGDGGDSRGDNAEPGDDGHGARSEGADAEENANKKIVLRQPAPLARAGNFSWTPEACGRPVLAPTAALASPPRTPQKSLGGAASPGPRAAATPPGTPPVAPAGPRRDARPLAAEMTSEVAMSPRSPHPPSPHCMHSPLQVPASRPGWLCPPTWSLRPSSAAAETGAHGRCSWCPGLAPATPPGCTTHGRAGQELCYLCMQRSLRNVPVYVAEERRLQEEAEERALLEYRHGQDLQAFTKEQELLELARDNSRKVAAFNLGVSEAVKASKHGQSNGFQCSFILGDRAATPLSAARSREYAHHLERQRSERMEREGRHRKQQRILEQLQRVQLARELALEREQMLQSKAEEAQAYQQALATQVQSKALAAAQERGAAEAAPVFGGDDSTARALEERRERARELRCELAGEAARKKRSVVVSQLTEQRRQMELLERNQQELAREHVTRHAQTVGRRAALQEAWALSAELKRGRNLQLEMHLKAGAGLVQEQCDKYKRCQQCTRRLSNRGESHVWKDSRYLPGTRMIL
ncbi:coiled-coil domain-containing protein 81 isoform X2 [Petromyzon marinus]|uniref:coiled-coil domain-containing protein 81 isoform X2 n=1 Tax=Petromyzon marinus TaxID=7757 RepID=UPI003F71A9BB